MSRFNYVQYDERAARDQANLKFAFEKAEAAVNGCLEEGRAKALCLTKLEEAYMWTGKGIRDAQIRRNGSAPEQPARNNE